MGVLIKSPISGFADEISSDLQTQLVLLKKLDLRWLEFRSAGGVNVADHTLQQAEVVRQILDAQNLRVSAVASPLGKIGIDEDFTAHMQRMEHVLDISDILGCDQVRVFSFFIPKGDNPEVYAAEVFRRTEEMVAVAQKRGKCLLHENEKGIYGDTVDRCLKLMQTFGGKHYKAIFDFANFVECGQDTVAAYQTLRPYIHYIHIKDASAKTHEVVLPGSGDGQLAQVLHMLDSDGYEGFLSLEPHLVDFAGLQGLEQNNAKVRGRIDGEEAFAQAHGALLSLLGR